MEALNKVPSLRFSEFKTEWKTELFGDVASFSKGKGISKSDISDNGQFDCIRYGELYTHYNERIAKTISKTNVNSSELVFSHRNDVIIPASGETQIDIATAACVINDGIAIGGDINIIRSPINGVFLAYYLKNFKNREIARLSQGVSVVHLYSNQLKTLKINIPSKNEQEKISNFLTIIDTKIDQLIEEKSLLEQYKRGLLQKIFTQEIRFKDDHGNTFPEWEEKKIGDIGEIVGGGTPDTFTPSYWGGEIIWFTPTEIKSKYIGKSIRTITELGLRQSSAKLLPTGTILLSSRATIGDVGIAVYPCCTNQGFQSIIVNENNFNEFIYYWIVYHKKDFLRKASGSTFLEINKTEISKLKIQLPSKKEQIKIGNLLSSIDAKIELLKIQIENAGAFKKGLLQQMFI